jgi:hypothetical protein
MRSLTGAVLFAAVLAGLGEAFASDSRGAYYEAMTIACWDLQNRYAVEAAARKAAHGTAAELYTSEYVAAFSYVAGWLTRFNAATADTGNIIPNGMPWAMTWLVNYCAVHPRETIEHGLDALIVAGYPARDEARR